MEGYIHAADNNNAKTNYINSYNKAGNSSKNFEKIHSTNWSATSQFDNKTTDFDRKANQFANLIHMPRKNQPQKTLTSLNFYEESESQPRNARQIQDASTTDATRTPVSTPDTSIESMGTPLISLNSKTIDTPLIGLSNT